jgi:hypothetical protein
MNWKVHGKKQPRPDLRYYPDIGVEAIETFSQDSQSLGRFETWISEI